MTVHSTGTTALITCATDGIDRALAHQLAGRVTTLLLHGRDSARLDSLRADLGVSARAADESVLPANDQG